MKKGISLAITLMLLACAALTGWLWRERAGLPYNEAGRYFDSDQGVVYDDGAVLVYGLFALAFAAMALMSALLTLRAWRR